jgi:hypothetical protein
MKSLFLILFISVFATSIAQTFKVEMAKTPIANPRPLLKLYGNQNNSNYEPYIAPTYTPSTYKEPEPATQPTSTFHRVLGYKMTLNGTETLTLLLELSTGYAGTEIVKVTNYKLSTSEYWEKISFPPTAYSNKNSGNYQYYNYKVYLPIGEVYFNF